MYKNKTSYVRKHESESLSKKADLGFYICVTGKQNCLNGGISSAKICLCVSVFVCVCEFVSIQNALGSALFLYPFCQLPRHIQSVHSSIIVDTPVSS